MGKRNERSLIIIFALAVNASAAQIHVPILVWELAQSHG